MTTCLYYNLIKSLKSLIYILEPKSLYYLQLVFFIINGGSASFENSIIY